MSTSHPVLPTLMSVANERLLLRCAMILIDPFFEPTPLKEDDQNTPLTGSSPSLHTGEPSATNSSIASPEPAAKSYFALPVFSMMGGDAARGVMVLAPVTKGVDTPLKQRATRHYAVNKTLGAASGGDQKHEISNIGSNKDLFRSPRRAIRNTPMSPRAEKLDEITSPAAISGSDKSEFRADAKGSQNVGINADVGYAADDSLEDDEPAEDMSQVTGQLVEKLKFVCRTTFMIICQLRRVLGYVKIAFGRMRANLLNYSTKFELIVCVH